MHAEYDSELPPRPPRKRKVLKPTPLKRLLSRGRDRVGGADPPISNGKTALAYLHRSLYWLDVVLTEDNRLLLVDPKDHRDVLATHWNNYCPSEPDVTDRRTR